MWCFIIDVAEAVVVPVLPVLALDLVVRTVCCTVPFVIGARDCTLLIIGKAGNSKKHNFVYICTTVYILIKEASRLYLSVKQNTAKSSLTLYLH